jgi:hypothetical protein
MIGQGPLKNLYIQALDKLVKEWTFGDDKQRAAIVPRVKESMSLMSPEQKAMLQLALPVELQRAIKDGKQES